jgi:hypothetical protein
VDKVIHGPSIQVSPTRKFDVEVDNQVFFLNNIGTGLFMVDI